MSQRVVGVYRIQQGYLIVWYLWERVLGVHKRQRRMILSYMSQRVVGVYRIQQGCLIVWYGWKQRSKKNKICDHKFHKEFNKDTWSCDICGKEFSVCIKDREEWSCRTCPKELLASTEFNKDAWLCDMCGNNNPKNQNVRPHISQWSIETNESLHLVDKIQDKDQIF